jgi:geranylgeranyl diphosphate synthase type II
LTLAFEVLARDVQPPAIAAACCRELAAAAGPAALVGGQADDLAGQAQGGGIEWLEFIHRRKTGAMFLAALRLGGLAAQASPEQLAALDRYGRALGLAFQITDDLLDVRGDAGAVGKRVGKDAERGKWTFPGLLGVDASMERARQLIAEASKAIAPLGAAAEGLEALAHFVMERDR